MWLPALIQRRRYCGTRRFKTMKYTSLHFGSVWHSNILPLWYHRRVLIFKFYFFFTCNRFKSAVPPYFLPNICCTDIIFLSKGLLSNPHFVAAWHICIPSKCITKRTKTSFFPPLVWHKVLVQLKWVQPFEARPQMPYKSLENETQGWKNNILLQYNLKWRIIFFTKPPSWSQDVFWANMYLTATALLCSQYHTNTHTHTRTVLTQHRFRPAEMSFVPRRQYHTPFII